MLEADPDGNAGPEAEKTVLEKTLQDIMEKTQSFLDTQHLRCMLMPSQNLSIGKITDADLQKFMTLEYYRKYYQEENARISSLLQIESLSQERPNPPDIKTRRVYEEHESVYELKNMYRFGESSPSDINHINPNRTGAVGTGATVNIFSNSSCVYLHPRVIKMDDVKNIPDNPKRYLQKSLVMPLRENPYFSSMFFQVLAQDYSITKGHIFP